ncbi:uncharacterized protein LOC124684644 [Lolium rigidum]|uniref:uncharacterized protein LOC124684644 n=1 Tax=Lolium rigidum TaxID=89674 RepID=UPI001F5C5455|nr:uncharacterized protein LOC124684644 [Lolium rigidum]
MAAKSVGEEFVDHRLLSRLHHFPDSKDLPIPLNMVAYSADDPPCQTTQCTNVAVQQYNAHQVDDKKKINNAVGVDSNIFILNPRDPISYWHLYFKGTVGRKRLRYFAELSGERGPEILRICEVVDKTRASVVNCDHCFGGIWHPLGGFIGSKHVVCM